MHGPASPPDPRKRASSGVAQPTPSPTDQRAPPKRAASAAASSRRPTAPAGPVWRPGVKVQLYHTQRCVWQTGVIHSVRQECGVTWTAAALWKANWNDPMVRGQPPLLDAVQVVDATGGTLLMWDENCTDALPKPLWSLEASPAATARQPELGHRTPCVPRA